jgi:hypothetical protein
LGAIEHWVRALEARHLTERRFSEVARALRALSSAYVQRRTALAAGAALDGTGKRAAFALFYGPLHFLVISRILAALGPPDVDRIVDLGCGTGAAGSAWAMSYREGTRPTLLGIDRHPWAVAETAWTYCTLGLRGRAVCRDLLRSALPGPQSGVAAAYTVNELDERARDTLLERMLDAAGRGAHTLVIEPISERLTPWWAEWRAAFEGAGGRADDWRFEADLPDIVKGLDRAAGLDHGELTAKSLWL